MPNSLGTRILYIVFPFITVVMVSVFPLALTDRPMLVLSTPVADKGRSPSASLGTEGTSLASMMTSSRCSLPYRAVCVDVHGRGFYQRPLNLVLNTLASCATTVVATTKRLIKKEAVFMGLNINKLNVKMLIMC
jgi:hypothetical protein